MLERITGQVVTEGGENALMSFIVKAIGYGLGALLATGGMFLIMMGAATGNAAATTSGWELVVIAVAMWGIGFIAREAR